MEPPSAALLWEAQMLCRLDFGEHEVLKTDMLRGRIFILTERKLIIPARIYPTDNRGTTLHRPPMGGPTVLLANIWKT